MTLTVRELQAPDIDAAGPSLGALLLETVNSGTPLGFMPPLSAADASAYWHSLKPQMECGHRILQVVMDDDRTVGSGQLALDPAPNGRHRAELQKMLVSSAARGQGVGRLLMHALHDRALALGRRLVILHTRRGLPAVAFYRALGYHTAGIIPGYSLDPSGEACDDVVMYQQLIASERGCLGAREEHP